MTDENITNYEMTQEGYDELEEELERLSTVKMKEIAQKLAEAREQGDLSENAEYDAAKNEQSEIHGRIEQLRHMLKYATVVKNDSKNKNKVAMGCNVKILDMEFDEEMEFKIVGTAEANSLNNKISNESPVGRALIGHKKGDTVKAETPAGVLKYKILAITWDDKDKKKEKK